MSIFELYDVLKVGMGYEINEDGLRLELYRLLSYVAGDIATSQLASDNPECAFTQLRRDFLQDEVINLLISTAIKGRLYDERYGSIAGSVSGACGTIRQETGAVSPLSLREAFNKIIHSQFHLWERETDSSDSPISTNIRLYGEQRRIKWEATLDICKYVHYSSTMIDSSKSEFIQSQGDCLRMENPSTK